MSTVNVKIAPSLNERSYYKKNATVADTLKLIKNYASTKNHQVKNLSQQLDAPTVEEYCRNIWNFVKENINYKEDEKGKEQVRQPARTWADREVGVDCDCYTTFISALLHLKNITHDYRVVSWTAPGKWAHIYPVAYDENGKSFAIDCIPEISRFNQQLKFEDKMDLEGLAGISDADLMNQAITVQGSDSDEYNEDDYVELNGMVEVDPEEEGAIKFNGNQLAQLNELDALATLQGAYLALKDEQENNTELSGIVNTPQEFKYAGNLMMVWQDKEKRDETLCNLSQNSQFSPFYKALKAQLAINKELKGTDEVHFASLDGSDDEDGLGKKNKAPKEKKKGKTKLGKLFQKARSAVNKVSPHMIALRNGFLLVMKQNAGGNAAYLKKALYTPEEAKAKGIPMQEYAEAKMKWIKVLNRFKQSGGEEKALVNAIKNGKAGGLNGGMDDSTEELGVAPVIAAALKIITGIIGKIAGAVKKNKEKKAAAADAGQGGEGGGEGGEGENLVSSAADSLTEAASDQVESLSAGTKISSVRKSDAPTKEIEKEEPTDTTDNKENLNTKNMAEDAAAKTTAAEDERPFLKRIWQDHKWWVIGGTVGLVLLIIFIIWMIKRAKKKKQSALNGRRRKMTVYARPSYRRSKPKSLNGGPLMLAGPRKKKAKKATVKRKKK